MFGVSKEEVVIEERVLGLFSDLILGESLFLFWLIYYIFGVSLGVFYGSLIDGFGFEVGSRWADFFGRDMFKC